MIVVSVSLLYLELYVLLCYARILLVFYTYTKEGRPPSFFFFSFQLVLGSRRSKRDPKNRDQTRH